MTEQLNEMNLRDAWVAIESLNMDKLLGITRDEFMFLAQLPKTMDINEMLVQLLAYRQYKDEQESESEKD